MKTEKIKVSYRDKTTNTNVPLGEIDAPRFENVGEAIEYFTKDGVVGESEMLEYVHIAHDIELQRQFREANRPDKTKTQSNTAKFKQLSPEMQEELLRQAGIIS